MRGRVGPGRASAAQTPPSSSSAAAAAAAALAGGGRSRLRYLVMALLGVAALRFYSVVVSETAEVQAKQHPHNQQQGGGRSIDPLRYPALGAMPLVVVWNGVMDQARLVLDSAASQDQYVLVVPFDLSLDNVAELAERGNAVIATFEVIQRKDFDANSALLMGLAKASAMIPSACFLLVDLTSPLWATTNLNNEAVHSLRRLDCDQAAGFGPAPPSGGLPFLLLPEKRRALDTHRDLQQWTQDWSKCIKRTFYNSPSVPPSATCAQQARSFVDKAFPLAGTYDSAVVMHECKANAALCDRVLKPFTAEKRKSAFAEANEWLFERKG